MSATAAQEAMIATIAGLLGDARVIAVGASSPLPAAAALLARTRTGARVLMLGNHRLDPFTDGGRELFDLAGQGRIDAFFLSGGQIDGAGNVNLLDTADGQRFPGSFGSPYLALLVPRLILFREEHSPRTLVERVDAVSAPGTGPAGAFRPGGPVALVTGRAAFSFDRDRGRFTLATVHPGETRASILAATGFTYDEPATVPETPLLPAAERAALRGAVAVDLAPAYPRFAASLAAGGAS